MERNINIQNTAARLRKTFQYPTDESSENNTPEALDEEEQETLITTLATQDATRNNQFRHLLLLIPLIASTPYLLSLISPPTNMAPRSTVSLLSLLSLSSLASTTFLVFRLSPTLTGFCLLDSSSGAGASTSSPFADDDDGTRRRRRSSSFSATMTPTTSPLETYLPYLNGGLCVLAVLMGWVLHRQGHEEGVSSLWLGSLPAIIYGAVIVAKMVMAGVDPERELSTLRYEFKGA